MQQLELTSCRTSHSITVQRTARRCLPGLRSTTLHLFHRQPLSKDSLRLADLDKLKFRKLFSGIAVKHDDKKSKPEKSDSSSKIDMSRPPVPPKDDDVSNAFNKLSLSDGSRRSQDFVGGFKHGPANANTGRSFSSSSIPSFPIANDHYGVPIHPQSRPSPVVCVMPQPQIVYMPLPNQQMSRTMQHALDWSTPSLPSQLPVPLPPRAHSEEPPLRHELSNRISEDSPEQNNQPESSAKKLPRLRRPKIDSNASGSSSKSSLGEGTTQCAAQTMGNKQCTRRVKDEPGINIDDPNGNAKRYCAQHAKGIMSKNTHFFSLKKPGTRLVFDDFIPNYLEDQTQVALRQEICSPLSPSDEPGYIYAFLIGDPNGSDVIQIKVGRAVSLNKRIDEWGKQCASKPQMLLGWWPGNIKNKSSQTNLLKGCVQPGPKGRGCHRLERLIHLELGDLTMSEAYLNKDFPNVEYKAISSSSTPTKKHKKRKGPPRIQCEDCGTYHREIFSFKRPTKGPYKDKEWEKIVMPIIEKWGNFVETHLE